MRILFFTQYFAPEVGAPQTRLDAMSQRAAAAGHDVSVVTAMPSYPTNHILEGYEGRWLVREQFGERAILRTWALPSMGTGFRRVASYAVFSVTGFYGLLRSGRPNVMIVESPPLTIAVPAVLWARARGVPLIFNVADIWPDVAVTVGALQPGRFLQLMFALERWAYRHAVLVTTVTDGYARQLTHDKGLAPDKVFVVPNGVDVEMFSPDAGDASILLDIDLSGPPFFVYAGTMGLAHHMDPLIDAFILLSIEQNFPHLLLIGAGSERARLEERVRRSAVQNIHFRDPVMPSDLARLLPLAIAGLVTMAELADGTRPAKMFPLMAAGIPVIFAGAGEGADCVRESGGGVAVPNEIAFITEALREIALDPELARTRGAAGRSYVREQWSWDGIVDKWLARLERVRLDAGH
jgi:colanic acid biosynthesis glycosyl transferase WcaI